MADFRPAYEEREKRVRRISKAREQLAADDDRRSAPAGTGPMLRRLARANAPALRPAHLCPTHQELKQAADDRAAENSR